jgi:hypothetical protein
VQHRIESRAKRAQMRIALDHDPRSSMRRISAGLRDRAAASAGNSC